MIGFTLWALACKTITPPPAPPDLVSESPNAVLDSEALPRVTITLDPRLMVYDESSGTVTFTPGGNVRAARYTHYSIDLESLEQVLGGRPTSPVGVVVVVVEETQSLHTPSDPTLPHPVGGFQITNRRARVIARAE